MKLRLVSYNKTLLLYCSNGSILKVDEDVLLRLLTEFDSPGKFKGNDGYWNTLSADMEQAKGITLAVVDDSLNLIVYNSKAFALVNKSDEYISASEYAELHGRAHSLIKRLCSEERIEGAQKTRSGWIIPKDASYPERKKREVKTKSDAGK